MPATYKIDVIRGENDGTLNFTGNGVNVSSKCWWDPKMKIVAGNYTGAATWMTNKKNSKGEKREGIYLGRGVKYNGGANTGNGAFIHMGTGPGWSDGCIVIVEADVLTIWNAITPKDAYIVEITISDETKGAADTGSLNYFASPFGLWGPSICE